MLKERDRQLQALKLQLPLSSFNPARTKKDGWYLMPILMTLSPYISRSPIHLAKKKFLIKSFPAWIRLKTSDGAVSTVENEVKMVARKHYRELPTVMKLPDGSNAPALGEWPGGLSTSKEPSGGQQYPFISSESEGVYILSPY